jgi:hypothetical protein
MNNRDTPAPLPNGYDRDTQSLENLVGVSMTLCLNPQGIEDNLLGFAGGHLVEPTVTPFVSWVFYFSYYLLYCFHLVYPFNSISNIRIHPTLDGLNGLTSIEPVLCRGSGL